MVKKVGPLRPAAREESGELIPADERYETCGAFSRRKQRLCRRPAGWGTDHPGIGACKLHGGSMRNHRIAAVRTMIDIELGATFGANLPVDIHPTDALIELVKMTAGYVRWLNARVSELSNISERNKQTGITELSVTVRSLGEYTDRLARFSKMALDAGVEERLVRVAEQQGDLIASMLVDVLSKLGLSESQKELVPGLVREGLLSLQGDAITTASQIIDAEAWEEEFDGGDEDD